MNLRLLYKLSCIAILFLSGLLIAGIIFPLLFLICSNSMAKTIQNQLKVYWLQAFSAIVHLKITKIGQLPKQPVMIVSNHVSWLDILVIGRYLPAYFVAKSDMLNWPIMGYLAKQSGTIFIKRGEKKHLLETAEKMVWLLKQQGNIIVFPEGTTGKGDEVLTFHASLFQPALLTKSVIQPVLIQYQGQAKELAPFIGDDEFINHLIKMLKLSKIEVTLTFLPVISTVGRTRQAVCLESRAVIASQLTHGTLINELAQVG